MKSKTKVQNVCSALGMIADEEQTIAAYSQMYDVAKHIEQKLDGIQCEEAAYEK